jgi:hypothetical protein
MHLHLHLHLHLRLRLLQVQPRRPPQIMVKLAPSELTARVDFV